MKRFYLITTGIFFILTAYSLYAETRHDMDSKNHDKLLRNAMGVFDLQQNTAGNFQFYTTNYGIFGFDVRNNIGGGYWPSGSQNQYLFAQGIWFGALKRLPGKTTYQKLVEITYNPNTGKGWFVPGRIEDGDTVLTQGVKKYRTYFSTDFNKNTGAALNQEDGPAWPFWKDENTPKFHFGTYNYNYVADTNKRNISNNVKGPLFISDEDIFSTYKDTDLNFYEGGLSRKDQGYPLGLQVDQNIYSWKSDELKDVIIISYDIENTSIDTLMSCWLGGVFDVDIARAPATAFGAGNDHSRFYSEDPSLNLAVAWTGADRYEGGNNFGYIGVSLIETPAITNNGFVRNDKIFYNQNEQIGLKTYRDWAIEADQNTNEDRYNFLSSGLIDPYNPQSGDKRILIVTGPFNMLPHSKTRISFAITYAKPAKGGEADGTTEDITGLKNEVKGGGDHTLSYSSSLIGRLKYVTDYYYNKLNSVENEPSSLKNGIIYPNPAGDYIQLPSLQTPQDFMVSIYSMEGKMQIELPYSETINISPLAPGAYFLRAGDKTYKFVKK